MTSGTTTTTESVPYSQDAVYEFTLEKRARVTMQWSMKYFRLQGLELSYKNGEGSFFSSATTSTMTLKSITKTVDKGGELYGLIIEGAPNKRWLVRAKDRIAFADAHGLLFNALCSHNALEVDNFGLPPLDPRVNLPFIDVPAMHIEKFGLLGKAVLYLFEDIVEVTEGIVVAGSDTYVFSNAPRVLILGDRCIYICTVTSDIVRCIRISEIQHVFVTPGEVAVGLKMLRGKNAEVVEPDLLLKNFPVAKFINHLTAIYNYLKRNKRDLPVEYQVEEDELLNHFLTLRIPATWTLKLSLPTARKNLAKTLEVLEENQRLVDVRSTAIAQGDGEAAPNATGAAPTDPDEEDVPKYVPHSDPLGLFLKMLRLDRYYHTLVRQHVDWEVFRVFELDDMECFGIDDEYHREALLHAVMDEALIRTVEDECKAFRMKSIEEQRALEQLSNQSVKKAPVRSRANTTTAPPPVIPAPKSPANATSASPSTTGSASSSTGLSIPGGGRTRATSFMMPDNNNATTTAKASINLDDDLFSPTTTASKQPQPKGGKPDIDELFEIPNIVPLAKKQSFAFDPDLLGSPAHKKNAATAATIDLDDLILDVVPPPKAPAAAADAKKKIILEEDDLFGSPRNNRVTRPRARSAIVNLDDI